MGVVDAGLVLCSTKKSLPFSPNNTVNIAQQHRKMNVKSVADMSKLAKLVINLVRILYDKK